MLNSPGQETHFCNCFIRGGRLIAENPPPAPLERLMSRSYLSVIVIQSLFYIRTGTQSGSLPDSSCPSLMLNMTADVKKKIRRDSPPLGTNGFPPSVGDH